MSGKRQVRDLTFFRERNAQIVALHNMNIPHDEIANRYGISLSNLSNILRDMRETARDKRTKKIFEMHKNGIEHEEIAKIMGLNKEWIDALVKREIIRETPKKERAIKESSDRKITEAINKLRAGGSVVEPIKNDKTVFFVDGKAVGVGNLIKMAFPKYGMLFA